MARGAMGQARALLERLMQEHGDHRLCGPARYELGRMAVTAGDPAAARRWLTPLIAPSTTPALRAAAGRLLIQIDRQQEDPQGEAP